jgi:hypothetical protein
MSRTLILILIPLHSYAFLDFLGGQAAKIAEAMAYTDAVSEVLSEVSNDKTMKEGSDDLKRRTQALNQELLNIEGVSYETKSIFSGPAWSSKRLDANIRSTTDYVRRVKRLLAHVALLGTQGATAFNTAETNMALNEVQKNQQAMILQTEDQRMRNLEKESRETKIWNDFSIKQRNFRQTRNKDDGKLK